MRNISILILFLLLLTGFYFAFNKGGEELVLQEENFQEEDDDVKDLDDSEFHGQWQSVDDDNFVRVLNDDNTFKDIYDEVVSSSGTWFIFDSSNKPTDFIYPVENGKTYLIMNDTSSSLNFLVAEINSEKLTLIYLDNGGVLQFNKVK